MKFTALIGIRWKRKREKTEVKKGTLKFTSPDGVTNHHVAYDVEISFSNSDTNNSSEYTQPLETKIEMEGVPVEDLEDNTHLWESRQLGADEAYARLADPSDEKELDEAFGLREISLKLKDSLWDTLKKHAHARGITPKGMIRTILLNFCSKNKPVVNISWDEAFTRMKNGEILEAYSPTLKRIYWHRILNGQLHFTEEGEEMWEVDNTPLANLMSYDWRVPL